MINQIHAILHRPEKGWDPISQEYAAGYGDKEWGTVNEALLDQLEDWIGGIKGKKVLDLGSGPGQYAIAFARRGAEVTCHDVSRTYLKITKQKAEVHGVSSQVSYSLGYLDEAPRRLGQTYDLVFNRVCWYYGFADTSFAKTVFSLVRPGGFCYIDTPHTAFNKIALNSSARFRMWLNHKLYIKIGHPFPPHGRLAKLFGRFPTIQLNVDYTDACHDRIWFQKSNVE